ncbi:phage scaffolding protein [Schnuerera sp.]|uniref:phage scaffolding protein n=1 Tax=Schnuerera sp. TaxID=2794844 RepID=UPI002C5B265D|nr:phage scaffolding protein [Schnuerera sp.]HSH35761.1 phage scaffolding protein [Schnuerera sp.]
MTKEQLEALGLNEEQIKEVFKLNGIAVNNAKADYETIKAEKETLEEQLETANKEIESYKEMDIEGIKKAAEDYKIKFETAQTEAQKELEKIKFNHALENALKGAKAKNVKAVKALLDLEGLKLNEDKIIGLDEQLESIKTENDYLFETEETKGDNPIFTRPTDREDTTTKEMDLGSALKDYYK